MMGGEQGLSFTPRVFLPIGSPFFFFNIYLFDLAESWLQHGRQSLLQYAESLAVACGI